MRARGSRKGTPHTIPSLLTVVCTSALLTDCRLTPCSVAVVVGQCVESESQRRPYSCEAIRSRPGRHSGLGTRGMDWRVSDLRTDAPSSACSGELSYRPVETTAPLGSLRSCVAWPDDSALKLRRLPPSKLSVPGASPFSGCLCQLKVNWVVDTTRVEDVELPELPCGC